MWQAGPVRAFHEIRKRQPIHLQQHVIDLLEYDKMRVFFIGNGSAAGLQIGSQNF
jgi:hypothetical protein